MKLFPKFPLILILVVIFCTSIIGQEKLIPVRGQEAQASSVDPNLNQRVMMNVAVWSDETKSFLTDLKSKDFKITQGKISHNIEFFQKRDIPLTVGIMVDMSGSMASLTDTKLPKLSLAVDGLTSFVRRSNPNNRYFVSGFNHNLDIFLEQPSDRNRTLSAFSDIRKITPKGDTTFLPALEYCLGKINLVDGEKKIILIVSDGYIYNRKLSEEAKIRKLLRTSNVGIYQANLIDRKNGFLALSSSETLEQFVTDSGGRVVYTQNRDQILAFLDFLADELRSQYIIGFTPTSKGKKKWHKVRIEIDSPKDMGRTTVFARNRYFY